jgi:hypothetical protein
MATLNDPEDLLYEAMMQVASGQLGKQELARVFRELSG